MLPVVRRIKNIFVNECSTIIHDKGIALIMIAAVFLYSIIYTIPYHNHILRDVPIAVIDNDDTSVSRKLLRALEAHEMIHIASRLNNLEQAKKEYYQNKIMAYLEIPKEFEKNIKKGRAGIVSAYLDSSYLVIYKQVATGLHEVTGSIGAAIEVNALMKKGYSKQKAQIIKAPFEVIMVPLYNPTASYQNYIYPQVLIMILQQTLLMGICLLMGTLYENLKGVRRRNKDGKVVYIKHRRISKFSNIAPEIVLGKGLAYFVIYFIYTLIFFFIMPNIVNYRMSYDYFSVIMLTIPFLLAVSFMGIACSIFCKSRESGMFVLVPSSVPFIFLSGFVWAKESIPTYFRILAKIIPTTDGIDGLVKINQMGASISQVMEDFISLSIMALIYFILACLAINKISKSHFL